MKQRTHKEDLIYEELELTELEDIEELQGDGLEQYFQDYRAYEKDLTQLIKDKK